ncbi:MAG TPA: hypothetical protein VFZ24_17025 [Longimicrobiales bacterium]
MKRITCLAIAALLCLSADADAQRRHRNNPFSFSPYVGAFMDAYDLEADDSNVGWLLGFRAGYRKGQRLDLHLNLGYAHVDDVATRPLPTDPIHDNRWVLLTGGADFALIPGSTSVAVGADIGVGWRQTKPRDPPPGAAGSFGWAAYETAVPSLTLRHQFTPRAGIFLSAQDYIFDLLEGPVQHSPALTFGLTLR